MLYSLLVLRWKLTTFPVYILLSADLANHNINVDWCDEHFLDLGQYWEGYTRVFAEEHPHRLASQHNLAKAYQADGQVKKAVELLEHVVAVYTRVLAEEHPNRLRSEHDLAMAYLADGQVKKAVELLEHVDTVRTRVHIKKTGG